jgi:hypothetical protein
VLQQIAGITSGPSELQRLLSRVRPGRLPQRREDWIPHELIRIVVARALGVLEEVERLSVLTSQRRGFGQSKPEGWGRDPYPVPHGSAGLRVRAFPAHVESGLPSGAGRHSWAHGALWRERRRRRETRARAALLPQLPPPSGGTAGLPPLIRHPGPSHRLIAIGDQDRLSAANPVQVRTEPRLELPGACNR